MRNESPAIMVPGELFSKEIAGLSAFYFQGKKNDEWFGWIQMFAV
ncbi:MAG: hypothetical protein RL399_98 [Actinomycetota bacterium]|jgi:hypothetical protein